ncbi:Orphan sodium- and chloride-dependent neurotransmitter transporter NTT5 [Lemmus lemmus]
MIREESDVFLPRQLWSSKYKYILAMISYLLMPAGLWRFVSQWLHRGGSSFCLLSTGSFLIMYTLMLFWVGIPLLFLEMAVGQRAQRGSIDLWKTLSPWFGGLGYSIFLVRSPELHKPALQLLLTLHSPPLLFLPDTSLLLSSYPCKLLAWMKTLLSPTPALSYIQGRVSVDMLHSAQVLYVLVPLPYFIIFCFFFWTLPMEGTKYGLKHLLVLEVATIYDPTVWSQAGVQVVLDMGLGFGPIVYFSSHMPDFNNCLGDALLMALIKMLTLLFVMPIILSILGFWAAITTRRCCKK